MFYKKGKIIPPEKIQDTALKMTQKLAKLQGDWFSIKYHHSRKKQYLCIIISGDMIHQIRRSKTTEIKTT